jgi:hypothetical protein
MTRDEQIVAMANTMKYTLDEIGERYGGITRQRVQRILAMSGVSLRRNRARLRKERLDSRKRQCKELRNRPCILCLKPVRHVWRRQRIYCSKCRRIKRAEGFSFVNIWHPLIRPALIAWLQGETEAGVCAFCASTMRRRKHTLYQISVCQNCLSKHKPLHAQLYSAIRVVTNYPNLDWLGALLTCS